MEDPKLHLVHIDRGIIHSSKYIDDSPQIFNANIKHYIFKGYLVNTSATALYFEPEDRNGLIVIPHSWVKWCVPIDTDKKTEEEKIGEI